MVNRISNHNMDTFPNALVEEENLTSVSVVLDNGHGSSSRDKDFVNDYHRLLQACLQRPDEDGSPPASSYKWKLLLLSLVCRSLKVLAWFFLTYFILAGLHYNNLWDPYKVLRIPVLRSCSKRTVTIIPTILKYIEVKEHSYSVLPGITFHKEYSGWNIKVDC